MTTPAKHFAVNCPGRMESHPPHRAWAYPYCTLQKPDPKDPDKTMCELIHDGEKKLLAQADEETLKLHREFVRAHGMPKCEYTILSRGALVNGKGGRDE